METTILERAMNSVIEQGVLGAILIILFLLFKKFIEKLLKVLENFIEKLFKVVENNTQAMTKNAEAIYSMKKIVERCDKKT